MKSQLESLTQEYQKKTKQYDIEIELLNEKLKKSLNDLNDVNAVYNSLKVDNSHVGTELISAKETINKQSKTISDMNNEIEQLKLLYETTSNESRLQLKVELEKLNKELDAKWKEILRYSIFL